METGVGRSLKSNRRLVVLKFSSHKVRVYICKRVVFDLSFVYKRLGRYGIKGSWWPPVEFVDEGLAEWPRRDFSTKKINLLVQVKGVQFFFIETIFIVRHFLLVNNNYNLARIFYK